MLGFGDQNTHRHLALFKGVCFRIKDRIRKARAGHTKNDNNHTGFLSMTRDFYNESYTGMDYHVQDGTGHRHSFLLLKDKNTQHINKKKLAKNNSTQNEESHKTFCGTTNEKGLDSQSLKSC